jgi:hypothetical protein
MGQGSAIVVVHLDPDGQTSHTLAWELQSSRKGKLREGLLDELVGKT